tara:strand:+ start:123 stop:1262 length:1140 start_codon:yes stop_codon:yes gene_type:complete
MKKILLIHNKYRNTGGEDTAVLQEINLLKEKYEVRVLFFDNNIQNYPRQLISFLTNRNSESRKILEDTINDFKPDIAYVHNTWFKASLETFYILKKYNIKTLLKLHNFRYDCTNYFFISGHLREKNKCLACNLQKKNRQIFNKYYPESYWKSFFIILYGRKYFKILKDFEIEILVLTNFHKRYLNQLGISKDKIYVFPNYVESNEESFEAENSYLLYAGRISEEKGVEELISTFIKSELNNVGLKIIGQGPMYKQLKQKYTTIDFLGEIEHSDVLEYIRKSLAVITCTKLYEGQPMLLCEASSLSVPSIYPETGGVSEFFPTDYALSFKQFDYSELLEKINMLKNPSFMNDLGTTNKDFLSKYLKKDKLISKFAEIANG